MACPHEDLTPAEHTFPDRTFSAQAGPYWGMPSVTCSQASTMAAFQRSIGSCCASSSRRSFSAYDSSVSGEEQREESGDHSSSARQPPPLVAAHAAHRHP